MTLALYGHPFSSYTWKVLIALYENATPFEFLTVSPDHPEVVADWLRRWPVAKFPLLIDGDRQLIETSVIIEYLQLAHPGSVNFIPADPMVALEVRFLDRVFDLHVMDAAQHAVNGKLTGDAAKAADGLATAQDKLNRIYPWLDETLSGRTWAAGDVFSLADCAAAPSLFYADWIHPIPEALATLKAYRARLLARPSVARAVDGARPYRHLFPLGAPDRD